MPKVKTEVSRRREFLVLAFIAEHVKESEEAVLSLKDIAAGVDISAAATRGALHRLSKNGLIVTMPRYYPNGASAENAYLITQRGLELLQIVEKAGVFDS